MCADVQMKKITFKNKIYEIFGRRYVIRRRVIRIRVEGPKKLLGHLSAKDFKENKKKALELINERIAYFNQSGEYPVGKVSIKNQKTRWGSCSGKRNLSFNYKLLFLPENLRDYIIIHELCHLKEMNHSKNFWNLVAEKVPDYKAIRRQIKLY
jgi:predicted metal-dependent hydrolase